MSLLVCYKYIVYLDNYCKIKITLVGSKKKTVFCFLQTIHNPVTVQTPLLWPLLNILIKTEKPFVLCFLLWCRDCWSGIWIVLHSLYFQGRRVTARPCQRCLCQQRYQVFPDNLPKDSSLMTRIPLEGLKRRTTGPEIPCPILDKRFFLEADPRCSRQYHVSSKWSYYLGKTRQNHSSSTGLNWVSYPPLFVLTGHHMCLTCPFICVLLLFYFKKQNLMFFCRVWSQTHQDVGVSNSESHFI